MPDLFHDSFKTVVDSALAPMLCWEVHIGKCFFNFSFFIFTSYERSECFIVGVKRKMLHNEVASSEKAGPDWVKHAFRRMKHFAALPQNMKHRRCGMKQSLFRLQVFLPGNQGKKNGGERGIRTLGEVAPTTIFETVAFGHSAISPLAWCYNITLKLTQGKGKREKITLFLTILLDF